MSPYGTSPSTNALVSSNVASLPKFIVRPDLVPTDEPLYQVPLSSAVPGMKYIHLISQNPFFHIFYWKEHINNLLSFRVSLDQYRSRVLWPFPYQFDQSKLSPFRRSKKVLLGHRKITGKSIEISLKLSESCLKVVCAGIYLDLKNW